MKINLVGWYGEKNAGDEAFRAIFEKYLGDHELSFTSQVNKKADLSIFGGGGVMVKSYLNGVDAKHPCYAVGVDIPLNGPEYKRLSNLPFREIYVRSQEYAVLSKQQGFQTTYAPDIVFGLDVPELEVLNEDPEIKKVLDSTTRPRLGIILTHDLLEHEHMFEGLRSGLKDFQQFYDLVFISMYQGSPHSDHSINKRAAEGLDPDHCFYIHHTHDPLKILGVISQLHMLVSMRFHGVIFAAIAAVPFMSLAQPGKHSLFCEQEGLKDQWVDLRDFNYYKLISVLGRAEEDREELISKLECIACCNQQEVDGIFEHIRETWLTSKTDPV
jgi:polysaccharide pyruvyl transferase WcaK-like protein